MSCQECLLRLKFLDSLLRECVRHNLALASVLLAIASVEKTTLNGNKSLTEDV